MIKNYSLSIEEIDNKIVEEKNIKFNLNQVVDNAKDGDFTLIKQLFKATSVKIYQNEIDFDKHINDHKGRTQFNVCTARNIKHISKSNIGRIVKTNKELVAYLVNFHNEYREQTGMPRVSLNEMNALHYASQNSISQNISL